MKDKIVGSLMVMALLANLFFCFWFGNEFLTDGGWFVIPGVVTLLVWFFSIALFFAVVADKIIGGK